MFDLDNDGYISMRELRFMLSGDGPLVDVLPDGQTVDEVMNEVSGGTGQISFSAFQQYLKGGPGLSAIRSSRKHPARLNSKRLAADASNPTTVSGSLQDVRLHEPAPLPVYWWKVLWSSPRLASAKA